MDNTFDKLNETFNVDSNIISTKKDNEIVRKKEDSATQVSLDEVERDYNYTRANLYSIIEKGQEAINGILEVAQEGSEPRAYEVVGQLIKNVSDATDKLMDLQKKLKDITGESVKGPTTVNNALFVGSTSELAKFLKQQSQINAE